MTIEHIHGGNLLEAADKYGISKAQIIDFSANINPLGPSPMAMEAIRENLGQIIHYPDPKCTELRQALGNFIGVKPENLIMGNGAAELIYLLVKLLKPKKVLIPSPTFCEYELAVVTNGGEVTDLMLDKNNGYRPQVEQVTAAMEGADMVIICNPNNPTGTLLTRAELLEILTAADRTGTFVLIDEAFVDFVRDPEIYSVLDQAPGRKNLMVLYSLTKFFGIPGLRLGSAVAHEDLIKELNVIKDPWNVNTLAQVAGVASFKDEEYIAKTREIIWLEMDYLYSALKETPGLKPYLPAANYIFVDVRETGLTARELQGLMAPKGILVRDCSSYKNLDAYYIRVAVKNRADNNELIRVLKETLEGRVAV